MNPPVQPRSRFSAFRRSRISRKAAVTSLTAAFLLGGVPLTRAQTIAPAFVSNYSFVDLGSAAGVPINYGGLTLKAGDPNTLLIGGSADNSAGAIYSIGVTRDVDGHINAFSGTASLFSTAANIDGGLAYGPGGVLFAATYSNNQLLQIKPGSSSPDKVIDLSAAGITPSTGNVSFVPAGFPGAGGIRILSYSGGGFYTGTLTPDGLGTYNLSGVALQATVGGGPEGIIYVPPGSPSFAGSNMLITEYGTGKVGAYTLDANGYPIPASRQDFLTGLSGALGAFTDPQTGDFLFSTYGGTNRVIAVRGFAAAAPEPASAVLLVCGGLALLGRRRRG